MIINIKYHIASLVAVFLALGIGILIGATLLGNDSVVNTQETLINNLRKDYKKILTENRDYQSNVKALQATLENRQDYEKKTLPLIVGNRLSGKQVAIVESGNFDAREDLVNTLTKISGATISSDTKILSGLNLGDQTKRERIAKELNLQGKTADEMSKEISAQIADTLLKGDNQKLIEVLVKEELIKTTGNYGVPVNAVIFIGGSKDDKGNRAEIVDVPMIKYFNDQNVSTYGVEQSDIAVSYIKAYQREKITTVDDVDLVAGQVALILSIDKQLPGDYGIKNTSKQLLPNLQ